MDQSGLDDKVDTLRYGCMDTSFSQDGQMEQDNGSCGHSEVSDQEGEGQYTKTMVAISLVNIQSSANDGEDKDTVSQPFNTQSVSGPVVNIQPLTIDPSLLNYHAGTRDARTAPLPDQTSGERDTAQVLTLSRETFEVVLKGGCPWGFALDGGKGTPNPLYISKVITE